MVTLRSLFERERLVYVFQQWIQLEAYVAVVAPGLLPHRKKHLLRLADQLVGRLPGDLLVRESLLQQLFQVAVEAPGLDQARNDDRVRGSTAGAQGEILGNQVRIDGIEPQQFVLLSDQGPERRAHRSHLGVTCNCHLL